MNYTSKALTLKAVSVGALMALSASTAFAGARVWDNSLSTCTTTNCSSLTIPGTVTNPSSNNDPFEIQLFARANECIRIEVASPIPSTADLETVVVAPNGSVYRNDDGVGVNPLVKINGAPSNGWYTVQINQWSGTPTYADFVLRYGRYNLNNPNCSGATTPVFAAETIKASGEGVGEPQPGKGTFTGQ